MIKLNNKKVMLGKFPDGTLLIKEYIEKDFSGNREAAITWNFENNEELVALIYLTKHLKNHGIQNIDLHMPYIPNARQDRVKNDEDVFTLKYFAEIINSLEFRTVKVLDPHSYVSEALINNIIIENPKKNIEKVIEKILTENVKENIENSDKENSNKEDSNNEDSDVIREKFLIMFYPDEGAMKRYSGMIDRPYTFGMKKRDWTSGQISKIDVMGMTDLINTNDVLIVDDICSRGGTFLFSAKELKNLGADNIYLYVSHCENTILEGELLTSGLIKKVFTTDSIFTKDSDIVEVLA